MLLLGWVIRSLETDGDSGDSLSWRELCKWYLSGCGRVWSGSVVWGLVRYGEVRFGKVRSGGVRFGGVGSGAARQGKGSTRRAILASFRKGNESMSIKSVNVTIKGTSALLMHSYPMVAPPKGWEKSSPEEQAVFAEYRDPDTNELYIPGLAIQRSLVGAAVYSKGKGRGSLQKPVAACVTVTPERCSLGVKEYKVDSRPVVIAATKGRIVRHRPRFDEWSCSFSIEYDTELLNEADLRAVVNDAGSRVGLLDFRPEKKGPFGRFMVTEWK